MRYAIRCGLERGAGGYHTQDGWQADCVAFSTRRSAAILRKLALMHRGIECRVVVLLSHEEAKAKAVAEELRARAKACREDASRTSMMCGTFHALMRIAEEDEAIADGLWAPRKRRAA